MAFEATHPNMSAHFSSMIHMAEDITRRTQIGIGSCWSPFCSGGSDIFDWGFKASRHVCFSYFNFHVRREYSKLTVLAKGKTCLQDE